MRAPTDHHATLAKLKARLETPLKPEERIQVAQVVKIYERLYPPKADHVQTDELL